MSHKLRHYNYTLLGYLDTAWVEAVLSGSIVLSQRELLELFLPFVPEIIKQKTQPSCRVRAFLCAWLEKHNHDTILAHDFINRIENEAFGPTPGPKTKAKN